jgi:hypothetical protein
LSAGTSRATRLGGLLICSGRSAHESTLASHEGLPGTRHLYGEVRCDALEELQRAALERPRPQVVVKVDRSGLNENHRVVRALNDVLKSAFDQPGKAGVESGADPPAAATAVDTEIDDDADESDDAIADGGDAAQPDEPSVEPAPPAAMRFKQTLVRLHPGERRGVSIVIDPEQIAPGTPVHVAVDPGLSIHLHRDDIPEPVRGGWSRLDTNLRCRVTAEPGASLSVLAEAAGHTAELVVLVVRHRSSGWVREIARKDEDNESEYLRYRMLEVEVAANTVYAWAAHEILARRVAEERPADPVEYAASVRHQTQALRYRAHDKLMRAFLDDEVFTGQVRIQPGKPDEERQPVVPFP